MKYNKQIQNEEGSALVYVLVVMTVVFLLVAGIVTFSVNENYQAIYQTDYIKAHYISRAGAEIMAMELIRLSREDKDMLEKFATKRFAKPNSTTLDADGNLLDLMSGADDLLVSVEEITTAGEKEYKIESVGTYNDIEAITKLTMSYSIVTDLKHVLFGNVLLDLAPQLIVGGVGSPGDITFHNTTAAGNADNVTPYVEFDIPLLQVDLDSSKLDDGSDLKDEIELTVIGDSDSDGESNDGDITTSISGVIKDDTDSVVIIDDLTINTSSIVTADVEYYKQTYAGIDTYQEFLLSDKIDSGNTIDGSLPFVVLYFPHDTWIKGKVEINGDYNVMMIVEDCLYMDGGLDINDDAIVEIYFDENPADTGGSVDKMGSSTNKNPSFDFVLKKNTDYGKPNSLSGQNYSDQFKVYLYGSEVTVDLDNNGTIYGFIISEDADINMKNGNTDVYGAVYGNVIDIDANVSIISPDPTVIEKLKFKEMGIDYWE